MVATITRATIPNSPFVSLTFMEMKHELDQLAAPGARGAVAEDEDGKVNASLPMPGERVGVGGVGSIYGGQFLLR